MNKGKGRGEEKTEGDRGEKRGRNEEREKHKIHK
jgi:hypothetical protein